MLNYISELLQTNLKTQLTITSAATGSGALVAKEWSITDPGVIVSIIGAICTIVVTVLAIQRHFREVEKHKLELELLRDKQRVD